MRSLQMTFWNQSQVTLDNNLYFLKLSLLFQAIIWDSEFLNFVN